MPPAQTPPQVGPAGIAGVTADRRRYLGVKQIVADPPEFWNEKQIGEFEPRGGRS
jgi:hypothetical protein